MGSARVLPATYDLATYGAAGHGRDYTSLAAWEDATDVALGSTGKVLECYADAASFDDYISATGASGVSATVFRAIKPAAGHKHDGTLNGGGVIFDCSSTVTAVFAINEAYFRCHDLAVNNSSGASYGFYGVAASRLKCFFIGCIARTRKAGSHGFIAANSYDADRFINCIAYECAGSGFICGVNVVFYNCTAVKNDYGFNNTVSVQTRNMAKNCISEQNVSGQWVNLWSQTSCTNNGGVQFRDIDNGDLHLAVTDTVARGNGTDLSADASIAFNDDVDRDTRSAWDIGADEYAPPPTAPSTPSPANGSTIAYTTSRVLQVTNADAGTCDIKFYTGAGVQIGATQSSVAAGATASVTWSGLTSGTQSWYATATNVVGTAQSSTWTFLISANTRWGSTTKRWGVGPWNTSG